MRKFVLALSVFWAAPAFAGDIVAKTNLPRGTILMADHVEGDLPETMAGQELKQSIYAGYKINPALLRPPVAVKRNSKVKMIYRSGSLTMTAWGRAMGEGAIGDYVTLMNLESRKQVEGKILPNGDVEVGL